MTSKGRKTEAAQSKMNHCHAIGDGCQGKEESDKKSSSGPYVRLPEAELCMCIWIVTTVYCYYNVIITAIEKEDEILQESSLKDGWLFGRKRDEDDFEWVFFSRYMLKSWHIYAIHSAVSLLLQWKGYEYRKYILPLVTIFTMGHTHGFFPIIVILFHCLTTYAVARLTKSWMAVWAVSAAFIFSMSNEQLNSFMQESCGTQEAFILLLYSLSMSNLRYTGFCIEAAWYWSKRDKGINSDDAEENGHFSLLDMVAYIFYLPVMMSGPVIRYDDFQIQFRREQEKWTKDKLYSVGKEIARFMIWTLVLEVTLHTVYFYTLVGNEYFMEQVSLWTLTGSAYVLGQFFHLKYVIFYGFSRLFAQLDHMKAAKGPQCISTISLYSRMWRNFDRGLYAFMSRYIYLPVGGSRNGMLRQVTASFLCFVFIYAWHGGYSSLLVWSCLNFLTVTLEAIGRRFDHTSYAEALRSTVGLYNYQRLCCLATLPVYLTSLVAIFIFLGNWLGYMIFRRIFVEGGFVPTATLCFCMYSNVVTNYELHRRAKEKEKTKCD